jgi:hypothetical protein
VECDIAKRVAAVFLHGAVGNVALHGVHDGLDGAGFTRSFLAYRYSTQNMDN